MKLIAIIALASAACVMLAKHYQRRVAAIDAIPQTTIRARDLPKVEAALAASRTEGGFAAILFDSPDWSEFSGESSPNVQMSFENGAVVVHWVLLAEPNVRGQSKIEEFLTSRKIDFQLERQNEVDYLRVSSSNPSEICRAMISIFRSLSPDDRLGLVYQGFSWDAA